MSTQATPDKTLTRALAVIADHAVVDIDTVSATTRFLEDLEIDFNDPEDGVRCEIIFALQDEFAVYLPEDPAFVATLHGAKITTIQDLVHIVNRRLLVGESSHRLRTITLALEEDEAHALRALEIRHACTADELLSGFIADLTGSSGTRGSDERDLAEQYIKRAYGDCVEYQSPKSLTAEERAEMEEHQHNTWEVRDHHRRTASKTLNPEQLYGIACVVCGGTGGAQGMVPIGLETITSTEVFHCTSCFIHSKEMVRRWIINSGALPPTSSDPG